jgi:lipopolysaccharide export system permease protein
VIQPGRFSSPEKGLTFHIRERTLDGTLHGLVMHDARKDDEVQSYLAEKGVLVEDKGEAFLFMMDGHILRRSGGMDEPTQIIAFDKYAVDLDSFDKREAGEEASLRPRERTFTELFEPVPEDTKGKKRDKDSEEGRLRSELHERFSSALYPLAFVLMAVAVVGQAQSTRQNRQARMGFCFLAGVGIRLSGMAVNNVVTINASAVPGLYLIPLVAIGVSLILIVRGARPSKRSALVERLVDAFAALTDPLKERLARRGWARAAGTGG